MLEEYPGTSHESILVLSVKYALGWWETPAWCCDIIIRLRY